MSEQWRTSKQLNMVEATGAAELNKYLPVEADMSQYIVSLTPIQKDDGTYVVRITLSKEWGDIRQVIEEIVLEVASDSELNWEGNLRLPRSEWSIRVYIVIKNDDGSTQSKITFIKDSGEEEVGSWGW